MEKIIDFFRNKYKILIPLMVVSVLLITLYFLYREYNYDNSRKKVEYEVSQFSGGDETDYTLEITYNLKDQIVAIKPTKGVIEYTSTPVYFRDLEKVLFPSEMTIAFPMDNGNQYKLYKYATYDNEYINNNGDSGKYRDFFLFDGRGLYFFPKEVTLYIDDNEYVKLGDMSYVSLDDGYSMIYYDNSKKEVNYLVIDGKVITVKSERINVNLSGDSFTSFSSKVLLFSPSNLSSLYKTD